MEEFTPIASAIGGALIGLVAVAVLLFNGRIAGVSGIAGGLLTRPPKGDTLWRVMFVVGLVGAGAVFAALQPAAFENRLDASTGALVLAGLLVGLGTRLGNGCTSGHGVCGIGRMQPRSLLATVTFVAFGAATVFVVQHLMGGGA